MAVLVFDGSNNIGSENAIFQHFKEKFAAVGSFNDRISILNSWFDYWSKFAGTIEKQDFVVKMYNLGYDLAVSTSSEAVNVTAQPKTWKQFEININILPLIGGALQKLEPQFDRIISIITSKIPVGAEYKGIEITSRNIKIYISEFGSPAIVPIVLAVVAALRPLLMIFGIAMTGYSIKEVLTGEQEKDVALSNNDIRSSIINSTELTKDQKALLLESFDNSSTAQSNEGTDTLGEFKNIIMIAIIGTLLITILSKAS